mmetsp:Transcript_17162/g.31105  ORF Transcript_17162/g.31105 Transcript_17162/m.31105 type:complete len:93 (-) Transcript_17162:160-438(-)
MLNTTVSSHHLFRPRHGIISFYFGPEDGPTSQPTNPASLGDDTYPCDILRQMTSLTCPQLPKSSHERRAMIHCSKMPEVKPMPNHAPPHLAN